MKIMDIMQNEYDYIIVGSGAGGGPLAANLVLAGFKVLLMEAGGKEESISYSVPAYAPISAENEYYRWDFYVKDYKSKKQQQRNPKFVPDKDGILYPRSSTVGGCTAHHAMITVYPADSDWEDIAKLMGDDSWSAINMRRYFQKLEECRYLDSLTAQQTGHGVSGWLSVEKADTTGSPKDWQLSSVLDSCKKAGGLGPINERMDPNSICVSKGKDEGFFTVPQSTQAMTRKGPREFLLQVAEQFPNHLIIKTHALATRILFDENDITKAIGIEYIEGAYLYKASPRSNQSCNLTFPQTKKIYACKEIILCCGVFNTPQLLMLSGIGPKEHLEKLKVNVLLDLPGVGTNLQDRYEISLVNEMARPFKVNEIATFSDNPEKDKYLEMWLKNRQGPYCSMGSPLMYLKKSFPDKLNQDLILFARSVRFQGFFPNWFWTFRPIWNQFTWTILKAHTQNRGGTVRLRSINPLDTPEINFNYFDEGTDQTQQDLRDLREGFKYARKLMEKCPFKTNEVLPGSNVVSDSDIETYIKDQAWGHHASCSCPMGPDSDKYSVLDSNFKVKGAKRLRVVDASVFPKIPGTFIVTPIYMISEKAADVIKNDANSFN